MAEEKTALWLKGASIVVIGFGIVMALTPVPIVNALVLFFFDLVMWPIDGAQNISAPETTIITAISGGVMVGWGILLYMLSAQLYPRDPALARSMLLWSICTWFVFDSAGSIFAGVPLNAFLNIGFLLAFVVPLWRSPEIAAA